MIAMSESNGFGWADRSILRLGRLSGARIFGSICIGTVIRVWLMNMKEIFNLKDELPRWWADNSIPHLM